MAPRGHRIGPRRRLRGGGRGRGLVRPHPGEGRRPRRSRLPGVEGERDPASPRSVRGPGRSPPLPPRRHPSRGRLARGPPRPRAPGGRGRVPVCPRHRACEPEVRRVGGGPPVPSPRGPLRRPGDLLPSGGLRGSRRLPARAALRGRGLRAPAAARRPHRAPAPAGGDQRPAVGAGGLGVHHPAQQRPRPPLPRRAWRRCTSPAAPNVPLQGAGRVRSREARYRLPPTDGSKAPVRHVRSSNSRANTAPDRNAPSTRGPPHQSPAAPMRSSASNRQRSSSDGSGEA